MALTKASLERNAFVKGLITEASPLTFPENASIDERNFVLNRDGSRQRRLGMDFEASNALVDTSATTLVFEDYNIKTYKWDNVENSATTSIGVIQIGPKLWFVDLFASTLSTNLFNSGLPLDLGVTGDKLCDFSSLDGKLIVVSSELAYPKLVEYDSGTDTISSSNIDVMVRDLWGVDDSLAVDNRPGSLSTEHNYNLRNQGWSSTRISDFFTAQSVYPSNADIVWFGKKSDGTFDSDLVTGSYVGTSPAAKGKYIIDAFVRGPSRELESGLTPLPDDTENGTPTAVASYAGRIFYSGMSSSITDPDDVSPSFAGTLLFTQVINSSADFGKCYQVADPTSEDISDLVDTDGGFIKIPEAGAILSLVVKDSSLIVIADNGVWEITGPDNVFRATDYSVTKITNIGCISKGSVINAEGNILYWAAAGIYTLSPNEANGRLQARNITETTIQTLYNEIPSVGKANATGIFDDSGRKIQWMYNDTADYDGIIFRKKYNKELVFDTVLQAYSVNEVFDAETNSPFVAAYMPTQVFNTATYQEPVVHNGEQVQVAGEDVVISSTVRSRGVSQTKYLCFQYDTVSTTYDFSFSQYINPDFKDWDSTDAAAYIITGHELFGDTQRKKMVNYLTLHFLRTENGFELNGSGDLEATTPSSCFCRARWDFADSARSGKWSSQFQGYRLKRYYVPADVSDTFDYGWEVITTKNKVRGSGKALSLRFDTEAAKDCYLLGWGLEVNGLSNV